MTNRLIKYLISFILLMGIFILGYLVYNKANYLSYDKSLNNTEGKVIAKVNGKDITDKDIEDYKKYNQGKLSNTFTDKDILNMFIEDSLLIEFAKDNRIKVSKKEIKNIIATNKAMIEKNDPRVLNAILQNLGITSEEYWENYAPISYAQLTAKGKAREKILKGIIDKLSNTHPEWTQNENKQEIDILYKAKLKDLEKQYKVEIL